MQSRTLSLRSFWGRNERLWDNRSPEVNLIGCWLEWNVVVKTKCKPYGFYYKCLNALYIDPRVCLYAF